LVSFALVCCSLFNVYSVTETEIFPLFLSACVEFDNFNAAILSVDGVTRTKIDPNDKAANAEKTKKTKNEKSDSNKDIENLAIGLPEGKVLKAGRDILHTHKISIDPKWFEMPPGYTEVN